MTQTMQYATMVAAVAEIAVGVVVAAPKICKYIMENGKKIKELVGNSKKLTSKIEGLIDDFNKII